MLSISTLGVALDGFELGPIDLAVDREVLAVLGPSGSGKTTLLGLLAGMVQPDRGRVALDGTRLDGRPPERRNLGVVFQDGALFPHMTARENVAYAASDGDRVERLAARLEIADVMDRSATTLSGGERQRVALARALAADPDALLLDEPLANLDAPIRRRLRDELHDLFAALDLPVVYVTHDQEAATALGDRIAVMHDGRFEQVGTPTDILERPASAFVASFTGSENLLPASVIDRSEAGVTVSIGGAAVQATGSARVGAEVTGCIRPARVQLADRGALADGGNVLTGTLQRWLHEGDTYRVTVDLDDAPGTLEASIPTVDLDGDLQAGATLRLAIPPGAIHVIG